MSHKYMKYKSKYLNLKSQIGGASGNETQQETYNTDFRIRNSFRLFGNNTNTDFGIDFHVDATTNIPDSWKYRHWDDSHDYIALVTFTGRKYPNSHINVDWNIEPNFNIMEEEEQYIIELRKINAFKKRHGRKIIEYVTNQFAQKYPHLVLSSD